MIEPVEKDFAHKVLEEFLAYPLDDGLPILERFAALPGAIFSRGEKRLDRYVFVPGTRKHPVVLVAHVDTVWDQNYPWTNKGEGFTLDGDKIVSASPDVGIGADDRAGCALLWLLRECGHSLLLLDGEEQGAFGAKHLIRQNPSLYRTLNRHAYMLELDFSGEGVCHYCDIPNTRKFRSYIESTYGCKPLTIRARTDIACLCRRICGANLAIGVESEHRPTESLYLSRWMNTYLTLCSALGKEQRVFPTGIPERGRRYVLRKIGALCRWIKK